jgi:DNA-binding MarR family transcriptional regulator
MHDSNPTPPRPLDEPESAEDALMSLMMALGRKMRQRQPGDAVDYSAFPILKALSIHGPMRLSNIAQTIGLDASTVSRHVRQLEDRGLLDRSDDPDDRRASRVAVSEQGHACLAEGYRARRHVLSAALGDWTDDEREALRGTLTRLVETLLQPDTPNLTDHNSQENL